jgi:hypothetical protein
MEDTHLDEFAAEDEPVVAPPPRPQPAPAASEPVRIVITDEQLASSWEMLLSEEPADAPFDGTFDAPFLQQADDDYRAVEPLIADPPPEHIQQELEVRRRSVIPATIVVMLTVVLIGGRTIMRQFKTAPPVAETAAPTQPAATSRPGANPSAETPVNQAPADPGNATPAAPETTPAVDAGAPGVTTAVAAGIVTAKRPARVETPTAIKTPAPPQRVARVEPPAVNVPVAGEQPRAAESPLATRPSQPAAERPGAAPATPVISPPAPPPAAAAALAPETRAVLITLYKYQEAFSNLDASAAHDIWPSVDVKALDRAFGQLDQQTVDLTGCNVGVNGDRAEAACTGTASYVQKVGKKTMRSEQRQWHFTLQQSEGQWMIDRVDARPTQ